MAGSLFEDSEDYFMRLSSWNIVRAAGLLSVTSVHIITRVNGRKIQTNILLTTDNYTAAAAQTDHGRALPSSCFSVAGNNIHHQLSCDTI